MKKYKKAILGVLILITVLLLISIGVNFWVKYHLPKMIDAQSKTYSITYKNLDIAVFAGTAVATDVVLIPRASLKAPQKKGIYATVQRLEIRNFKILSVLFSDRISARSLSISKPEVILYKSDDKAIRNPETLKHAVVEPFEKVISVSDVYLYSGDFKIIHLPDNEAIMSVSNINLQIDGIKVTDETLKGKIPFGYEKYAVSCDSFYSNASPFYDITAKKIATTNTAIDINGFRLVPKFSRRQFVRQVKTEKDLFEVTAQKIKLNNVDWGYKGNTLFFNATSAIVDHCEADIYRNKIPADDLKKKHLYNKLLRDLDFYLKLDTLKVRNSLLAYEEEKSFDKGSGKLVFSHFNLTAHNICSGFQQKKLPDLKIKIDCKFMDAAPMHVDWWLNVLDKSDGFHIKGTIVNVDADKVNAFSKPYINATTEGKLNKVMFNFTGNDQRSRGEFALEYDDFKLTVYQKNKREKKNKFLTAIGNLFVKNDSKGEVKGAKVEVERIPEKSFYNFFWRNIAEGLLKIFI